MSGIALFETPSSWAWSTLGQVFDVIGGSTPVTSENAYFAEQGIPWITPADLSNLKKKFIYRGRRDITEAGMNSCGTKILPKHSVLFSTRAPIGHIAIAGNELCTNQGFKSIAISDEVISTFIFYYLKHITPHIQSKGSGTTFKEVSGSVMKSIPVVFPPRLEQQRIVTKIESCFSKLDTTETVLERVEVLLKKYRESLLAKAFRGALLPQDPNDEPASELLKRIRAERQAQSGGKKRKQVEIPPITEDEIPFEIPTSWEWVRLGEITSIIGGVTVDAKRDCERPVTIPYLRVANVQRGFLDLSKVKEITVDESDAQSLKLLNGDILFTEGGDLDKLGRGWIWANELPNCIHQNHIFRARLFGVPSYAAFISTFSNSFGQQYFLRQGKKTTNLASINITKLSLLPIPLAPEVEMLRIISELAHREAFIARLQELISEARTGIQQCRNAVLSTAFCGQLVEQLVHEGSGHELLREMAATIESGSQRKQLRPRMRKSASRGFQEKV